MGRVHLSVNFHSESLILRYLTPTLLTLQDKPYIFIFVKLLFIQYLNTRGL